MQECCPCGSARGALGNRRPYRDTYPRTYQAWLNRIIEGITSELPVPIPTCLSRLSMPRNHVERSLCMD